ncbi:MAG: Mur ligase domain-containing protein, partial [Cyanobacteria bacterium P01_H01_bin.58]
MACQVSLQHLAQLIDADMQAPSGYDPSQVQVLGISTDTRLIQAEYVFLALQGERFDGHQFAEQALNMGAVGVIGQVPMDLAGPQLLVQDTLLAYQKIARWWRQNLGLPIVAITG